MIHGWICLLLAVASSASMTEILKIFRNTEGNRYGIILGNYLICVVIGFLMMRDKAMVLYPDRTTLLCGVIGGILYVAGLVSTQESIAVNGAILSSAFGKLGLTVPLVLSIFLFGERPKAVQAAGLAVVIIAMIVISSEKHEEADVRGKHEEKRGAGRPKATDVSPAAGRPENKGISSLLLLCVTLCCGMADTMSKIFEHTGSRARDEHFFLLIFFSAAVLTGVLAYGEFRKTGRGLRGRDLLMGVAAGIPNYYSSFFLLKALVRIPAIIVYPGFSTGTIALVTLVSAVFLRERPGRRQWTGIVMIAAALVLLNI